MPHQKLLRAWQLAIIRFAVTLDSADRLNVLALGKEIDRFGRTRECEATLHYFRRSSAMICAAILEERKDAESILLRYLAEVEDPRMRRTSAAAVGLRLRPKRDDDLFAGLPLRKVHA